MTGRFSLRIRLILVILTPLMVIAALVGSWAYIDAQANAADRFDRSLLSTALAVSRDIAVSGGDAVSQETRDLIMDTSGGAVFYHVYAPDGVFVTGYATPPVPPDLSLRQQSPLFYDAIYQRAEVRALRLVQTTSIDNVSGRFTFTVWQNTSVRDGFVRSRTQPVFLIIASMIGALAVIVWFGVAIGLAPLIDLEDAIARRSSDDMSPIKRDIPVEIKGIVGRFNSLLQELSQTMNAKDAFISDAAHQLRNPIAGVLSLADAVAQSRSLESAKQRADDLVIAAREAGHLTNNLLALERMKTGGSDNDTLFAPDEVIAQIEKQFATTAKAQGVAFSATHTGNPVQLYGNRTMFGEAIKNVLGNTLQHGGGGLKNVTLQSWSDENQFSVQVSDDGKGIAPTAFQRALDRFSQIGPSAGSGLGLPIAQAVAERFSGDIALNNSDGKFTVTLVFQAADHLRVEPFMSQTSVK